jgi:L-alanine-DL-glutamate epimerase-like enolase superfamily enzyme
VKITSVETIRTAEQSNLCFVTLTTDSGLVGLGESFYGASAVEAHVHDQLAPTLLALEDPSPHAIASAMRPYVGYQGGGAETRALGAVDMALWDLLGKQAGLPLWELLGGKVRSSVRTYNTCAGTKYVSSTAHQTSSNWGIGEASSHPYEDLVAFLTRPRELARSLKGEGYTAMKIWPFDQAAERNHGVDLTNKELEDGVRIVAEIRDEVGYDLDIMIELHGLWLPRGAVRIAQALEPYRPFWLEDPIRPDAVNALQLLKEQTSIPIATGETTVGRRGFLPLLNAGVVDVVTVDVGWTGGITEALRVSSLADTFGVSLAPHDCTGPVSLAIATHLICTQTNGLIQESSRAFLATWYRDLAEGFPTVVGGVLTPSNAPGHGVTLADGLVSRPGITVRSS